MEGGLCEGGFCHPLLEQGGACVRGAYVLESCLPPTPVLLFI